MEEGYKKTPVFKETEEDIGLAEKSRAIVQCPACGPRWDDLHLSHITPSFSPDFGALAATMTASTFSCFAACKSRT